MKNEEIIIKLEKFFDEEYVDTHEYIWGLDLSDSTKEKLEKILIIHRNYEIVNLFENMSDKITDFGKCNCENVEFGTYDNQVVMKHPSGKLVCIDTCIATEIGWLWHQGINTLNSCCGHKKLQSTVIVHSDDYEKMDDLGYKFDIAPSGCREYFLRTKGTNNENQSR